MFNNIEFSKQYRDSFEICFKNITEEEEYLYFSNLHDFQIKYKTLIDNNIKWNTLKKKYNYYDLIYRNTNSNNNISHIKVISRAYFKLNEIIIKYNLHNKNNSINYLCLCEAPGGFIEYLIVMNKYKSYNIFTMSINDKFTPVYKYDMFKNPRIHILQGVDTTGNLYNLDNILSIGKHVNNVELITADGGFDISNDYNNQEEISFRLIFCECVSALIYNQIGGTFIVKIFDIFKQNTMELLYLMSCSYEYIDIYKPCLSRICNSEKYVIFRGFKGISKNNLDKLKLIIKIYDKVDYNNFSLLKNKISRNFVEDIYELNKKYVFTQCVNILYLIHIDSILLSINYILNKQIYYGLKWCQVNNCSINYNSYFLKNYHTISKC